MRGNNKKTFAFMKIPLNLENIVVFQISKGKEHFAEFLTTRQDYCIFSFVVM